jgi:hypothetical protein
LAFALVSGPFWLMLQEMGELLEVQLVGSQLNFLVFIDQTKLVLFD